MQCGVQEGTLKLINKDRNRKTTANIQQGLPFTIAEVKRQTEDPKLLEAVNCVCLLIYGDITSFQLHVRLFFKFT